MEIRDLAKEAIVVSEDSTFRDALAVMMSKHTNTLLVVNDEGRLTGELNVSNFLNAIVPELMETEDVLEKLNTEAGFAEAVQNAADKEVGEFMTIDVQPIHVDDTLLAISSTAIAYDTQHIPIVDHDDRPIGVISRRGLKHILAKYLNIHDTA